MVMKQVGIAELKAHLSQYLRAVRKGQTVLVLDRETPIAQIVPVTERTRIKIRKPERGAPPFNQIRWPAPLNTNIDIVDLLLEERQNHR